MSEPGKAKFLKINNMIIVGILGFAMVHIPIKLNFESIK